MVIYLTHPRHGTKVAISEPEAVLDEANGWVRFDVNAKVVSTDKKEEVKDEVKVESNAERDELTKKYVDRFGKKPHWKMTLEQIQEELCQPPST